MQQDLDNGLLDLIVTPHKGSQQNLLYFGTRKKTSCQEEIEKRKKMFSQKLP
ncbi:hypothetical protein [Flavihumibacter sp. CACIAM 22H1]|uniref:hypothetical protein n=1 Tax=Flavihumibacter sp. CACIAM 22H1 TaxID=1812911 RepID=UPI000AC9585E|nr:hypothetical protein [Flavihumibacter sp. CACIAM 22H1]